MPQSPPVSFSRSLDPRAVEARTSSRRLTRTIAALTKSLERSPETEEIAEALQLSNTQYRDVLTSIADHGTPGLELLALETSELDLALLQVPKPVQNLLALYYHEECTAEEVGMVLGMTAARAHELHAEAIHRLQAMIVVGRSRTPVLPPAH